MKSELIQAIQAVAREAGEGITKIYQQHTVDIKMKQDNSPLTEADTFSHQLISQRLKDLTPDWPVISEEGQIPSFEARKEWDKFWLIDPLDGTKEFINKTGEFTINIALIEKHQPILGIVYVPITEKLYCASVEFGSAAVQEKGGAWQPIQVKPQIEGAVRVTLSRRHGQGGRLDTFLKQLPSFEVVHCGSTLKICLIAEGLADIYPRFGPTSEWDTAAGQCILEAAGGALVDFKGQPLRYGTKESLLNPEFLAFNEPDCFPRLAQGLGQ